MSITVEHNPEFLDRAFRELRRAFRPQEIERLLRQPLAVLQAAVIRSTQTRLAKDPTGALARSWEIEIAVTSRGAQGGVRSPLPYARIHNQGGIITPKRGRYLAIPIGRTPRGMQARHDPTPLAAWRSRAGNLILWSTGNGAPEPRYVLKESVRIPATHYLDIAIRSAQDDAIRALEDAVSAALSGAE